MEDVDFVLSIVEVDVEEGVASSIEEDISNGLNFVPSGQEDENMTCDYASVTTHLVKFLRLTFIGLRENPGDNERNQRIRHYKLIYQSQSGTN